MNDDWIEVAITASIAKTASVGLQLAEYEHHRDAYGPSGRVWWLSLPIYSDNELARRMAQRKLSGIMNAIGLAIVTDTEQMHGKHFYTRLVDGTPVEFRAIPKPPAKLPLRRRLRDWFELKAGIGGDLHRQVYYAWRDYPDAMKMTIGTFFSLGFSVAVGTLIVLERLLR